VFDVLGKWNDVGVLSRRAVVRDQSQPCRSPWQQNVRHHHGGPM